jgi:hypothetical protein
LNTNSFLHSFTLSNLSLGGKCGIQFTLINSSSASSCEASWGGECLCMQQKHVRHIKCQTHQVQTWRAMDHNCRHVLVFVMLVFQGLNWDESMMELVNIMKQLMCSTLNLGVHYL